MIEMTSSAQLEAMDTEQAVDYVRSGRASAELVWCETPYHGPRAHAMAHDCKWPHLADRPGATFSTSRVMWDLEGHGNTRER